jgi:hypothetical protein
MLMSALWMLMVGWNRFLGEAGEGLSYFPPSVAIFKCFLLLVFPAAI